MRLRWPPNANGNSRRKTTWSNAWNAPDLLAPEGDVDKILQTVVNNIEITNNIELPRPVRTRVLTTSPLETFSVGNTIVVSRGLIDVLPDEGSLAMVLSHELAHIVLGHNLGSQYAFNDRMLFSDEGTYQNLGFKHIPEEETAADKKAIEMLKASPYAQKLETAGLFIKALQARAPQLSSSVAGSPRQQHLRKRDGHTHGGSWPPQLRRSTGTSWTRSPRCPWADASS